MVKDVKYVK